jgi:hypothetical protein
MCTETVSGGSGIFIDAKSIVVRSKLIVGVFYLILPPLHMLRLAFVLCLHAALATLAED